MKIQQKYLQYDSALFKHNFWLSFFFPFWFLYNTKVKEKFTLFKTRTINFFFSLYYLKIFYSEYVAEFHLKAHKLEDFWNLNAIFYNADFFKPTWKIFCSILLDVFSSSFCWLFNIFYTRGKKRKRNEKNITKARENKIHEV